MLLEGRESRKIGASQFERPTSAVRLRREMYDYRATPVILCHCGFINFTPRQTKYLRGFGLYSLCKDATLAVPFISRTLRGLREREDAREQQEKPPREGSLITCFALTSVLRRMDHNLKSSCESSECFRPNIFLIIASRFSKRIYKIHLFGSLFRKSVEI